MREKALELAVNLVRERWIHDPNHHPSMVVDIADEFLVFLEGKTKVLQPIKNPAAKGQPR